MEDSTLVGLECWVKPYIRRVQLMFEVLGPVQDALLPDCQHFQRRLHPDIGKELNIRLQGQVPGLTRYRPQLSEKLYPNLCRPFLG